MAAENEKPKARKLLRFLTLDNPYRRVARLYPALLTIAMLLPVAIMLGIQLTGGLAVTAAGGGLAITTATAGLLSHLASAAGNRIQRKLYPRWPHDSPTNQRLHPLDKSCSQQQKQRWYEAIQRLTGIDIASVAGDPDEAERAINDALIVLRTKVLHGNKLAERLDRYNADYGFVRNFAGLRPAWLLTSFSSFAGCWIIYAVRRGNLALPVIASALFTACMLAAIIIAGYVRHTANHYADSFFGALDACDEEFQAKAKRHRAKPFSP